MIDENQADLAPKIRIDRSRRIEQGDPVGEGKAAARSDLGFIAGRDRERKSGGNKGAVTGIKDHLVSNGSVKIKPRSIRSHAAGQGNIVGIWIYSCDLYLHCIHVLCPLKQETRSGSSYRSQCKDSTHLTSCKVSTAKTG